jgi:hypothetical protein
MLDPLGEFSSPKMTNFPKKRFPGHVKKIFSLGGGHCKPAHHNNLQLFACFIVPIRMSKSAASSWSTPGCRATPYQKSDQKNRFSKKPVRETGLRNRLEVYPAEHTSLVLLAQTACQTDQYWPRSITANLTPKFLTSFCLGFFFEFGSLTLEDTHLALKDILKKTGQFESPSLTLAISFPYILHYSSTLFSKTRVLMLLSQFFF